MSTYGVNDVYGVGELEATGRAVVEAHERGHDLGEWRPINERMRLAKCRRCGRLVWIVRPPGEELSVRCAGGHARLQRGEKDE